MSDLALLMCLMALGQLAYIGYLLSNLRNQAAIIILLMRGEQGPSDE